MGPVFIVVQVDHLDAITGDLLLFHRFIEEYSNNILERERERERDRERAKERAREKPCIHKFFFDNQLYPAEGRD